MQPKRQRMPLSMTSLIDVIFLLLLFFMLSSTFSKFAEIPLTTAGQATAPQQDQAARPVFVRLDPRGVTVNGQTTVLEQLATQARRLVADAAVQPPFILSVKPETPAEVLVQAMHQLRQLPKAQITVVR